MQLARSAKSFRWKLEGLSSIAHVGIIGAAYAVFGVFVVGLAILSSSSCAIVIPSTAWCVDAPVLGLLAGEATREYPKLTLLVGFGKPLLTILATSILTISLLRDTGRIALSEKACIYERSALELENASVKSPCLVFRMLNQGGQFIFDVSVKVALRFVGQDRGNGKTFRFFPLKVLGAEGEEGLYPMLQPGFPFRVYVRLDQDVQSAIYLGTLKYEREQAMGSLAEALSLLDRDGTNRHSGNTRESAVVVSVRGKDSISGKDVVISIEFPLTDIKPGKFRDICLADFMRAPQRTKTRDFNAIEYSHIE